MHWIEVLPRVYRFADSCNVYAVHGPAGMLVVNAGTGYWLDHAGELPAPPAAVAMTHFFRDHSAGAARAAREGLPVCVPAGEVDIFRDPVQHFRQREDYITYDNYWDHFAPIEPVDVAGVLHDYTTIELAGLQVELVPLPGVTMHQVGLAIALPEVGEVVFCGEAICAPGKLPRVAPLQYSYNDMLGAGAAFHSATVLAERGARALLPSLGEPILEDTVAAAHRLRDTLVELTDHYQTLPRGLATFSDDRLEKVTDHLYRNSAGIANCWVLVSDSGKVMTLDYGYGFGIYGPPQIKRAYTRRVLRHTIRPLREQLGIDGIDVVLVSHFHDDHVAGIPMLQRLYDTQVWVPENFADLLAMPQAHAFPCNWPEPIRIDRRLPLDQTATWEEYTFHFAPMSGHTRFAALIGFEADGRRIAHTGDQYFFQNGVEQFDNNRVNPNHVYRNGCLLDGLAQSGEWLLAFRPDVVIQGHQPPMFTDSAFFERIAERTEHFQRVHRQAMVLDEDLPHFDADSWGGWLWPYRTHLPQAQPITLRATVRNPLPRRATLTLRLVGPIGWEGGAIELEAAPRAEVSGEVTIVPPPAPGSATGTGTVSCRRQPIALELLADGQPFGQVAEALVTIGNEWF